MDELKDLTATAALTRTTAPTTPAFQKWKRRRNA